MSNKLKFDTNAFQIILGIGILLLVGTSVYLLLSQDSQPAALDMSQVRTITDPVPPEEVAAYAELADADTLALGETVYMAECAACHGIDGEGQFPAAPMQPDETGRIGAPPHDETGHTWHHDDDLLIRYIIEGGQAPLDRFYPMPGFEEKLSEEEILAVIAYIKTMWTEEQRLAQAEHTLITRAGNR